MKHKRTVLVVALVLFAVGTVSLVAKEWLEFTTDKRAIVSLTIAEEFSSGETVIPRGHYQISCDHSKGKHELVFREAIRRKRGGYSIGAEVARAKCRMEDLAKKNDRTSLYAKQQPSGRMKLTEILIRGEQVRHLLD